jgi:hypothetical protein
VSDWTSIEREADHQVKLATSLEHFAAERLKVRPKTGGLQPFVFNAAQRKLHAILEDQKRTTGRVRAVILKGRQMGVSTYVAARFYRHVTTHPGLRCSIIAHEAAASRNLYGMVRRFHDAMPAEEKQSTGTANADELLFDKIDSGYLVSVANPEGSGRSSTVQLVHASEVGFWADLAEQTASLLQAVPEGDGSEVIMESTANAFGDQFHQLWRRAEAGESEFLPVFLSWAVEPLYRAEPDADFKRTAEETELAAQHSLDDKQLQWRRNKIRQLGDARLFMREYPLTAVEAFQAAEHDSFISSDDVMRARKCTDKLGYGPLVIGVDPARKGGDSTCVAWRRGRSIVRLERYRNLDLMQVAGLVAKIIDDDEPTRAYVDSTGLGVGIVDRLHERGYADEVEGVNFSGKSTEAPTVDEAGREQVQHANRRAQIYGNLKQALSGQFVLPDRDDLHSELVSMGYKYASSGAVQLESKDDIRKRLGASPDLADAVALTMTTPAGSRIAKGSGGDPNFNRDLSYPKHVY